MDKTLYVIDSYGLIFRSYYAFLAHPLTNKDDENVSAVHGFFTNMLSLIQKNGVQHLVAAFDPVTKTFRHEMYPEYKANRPKAPDDLHAQVPLIENALNSMGVKVLKCDGFEADDIIATLAQRCKNEGWDCRILSSDKDLMQLVDERTMMIKSDKIGGWETIGIDEVETEWGVKPERMLDILSLIGDTADNVPGVAGIGKVSAQKLLSQYDNLDSILENAENISGATGKKIQAGIESAKFSRELIKLRYDVPLDFKLDDFSIQNADYRSCAQTLFGYGLSVVSKRMEAMAVARGEGKFTLESEANSNASQNELNSEETETPFELEENNGNYTGIKTASELEKIIDGFLTDGASEDGRVYVAFDSETNGLDTRNAKFAGFSICNKERTSYYIPFVTSESNEQTDLFATGPEYISQHDAFVQLARLFFNPKVTILMHNAKFDLEVLASNGFFMNYGGSESTKTPDRIKFTCKLYDTMIAAWLLQKDKQSNSLEKLAEMKLHLKTIPFESIVAKGKTFFDVPYETAVKYGAEDSDLTLMLWNKFKGELEEQNLMELFETMEMPLIPVLAQMELSGIHIEKQEMAEYSKELSEKIAKVSAEIYEICGHEFNIASPKQLAEVLFNEMKFVPPKGKKVSTDITVLEEIAQNNPDQILPAKILEYRKYSKLQSTYADSLIESSDKNDRIHTDFIQTGTTTGRLSSHNPNLQNIPVREEDGRRIRQCFSATEGKCLISADYSQIELVVLAHTSGDKNMCAAFNSGTDVHKATASLIFGVSPEQVTSEMRRTAKTINFGVIYGMSSFRLASDLEISRTQAGEFIKQYFATYSGVQDFIKETIQSCEKTGYVETIFGRRRYIRAINSKNKFEKASAERMAVNTPIQGTAADIVKKAMLAMYALLEEKFPDARMLLQVHDEIIVEADESQAHQVADAMKNCMENIVKLNVPLRVSVEIGKRWGEFH